MNMSSILDYNDTAKTIEIASDTHLETMEALKYLIDNEQIDPFDFDTAVFSCTKREGALMEIKSERSGIPYHTIIIDNIDLRKVDPKHDDFDEVKCVMEILELFNLNVLESIEGVLEEPENYMLSKDKYQIFIKKNGLMSWETRWGSGFIYD